MVRRLLLGVMSVTWMVAIAALVAVEKLLPRKEIANRLVAITLLILGVGVALAPQHVPGLTLPDAPQAQAVMHTMSGTHTPSAKPDPGMKSRQ
jgi:hypothetical protein